MNKQISIIIPAHNEEENIGRLLNKIKESGDYHEVIVVDDASIDRTAEIAASYNVKIITHPYCMGNGASIKTGARAAEGNVLVFMDGDGQHNPDYIKSLTENIGKYDMVVGARIKDSKGSLLRRIANWGYNQFSSYISGFRIEDLTSGFRAVKRDVFMKFIPLLPNGFSYPTTITITMIKSGRPIKFVPIITEKRKGKSKINILRDGHRFILIIIKIATLFTPMKIFLPVSLCFFITGMSNYIYTYVTAKKFTNMSALLLSISVVIFMIGLVSEQIATMRIENIRE